MVLSRRDCEVRSVKRLEEYCFFVESLRGLHHALWSEPIADGKWSIREIIGHIAKWDEFLATTALPGLQTGNTVSFPENPQEVNQRAAKYARETAQQELIDEAVKVRHQVINEFTDLLVKQGNMPISINGAQFSESGEQLRLQYLIDDFAGHDAHHKKQIKDFLLQKSEC